VGRIDVVGAHGQLEASQPVLDPDAPGPGRGDAPGVLVHLGHRQRSPVLVHGVQAVDVALVLPDQIAARRPHRQARVHRRGAAGLRLQGDLRAARLRLRDPQDVRSRHARGSVADECPPSVRRSGVRAGQTAAASALDARQQHLGIGRVGILAHQADESGVLAFDAPRVLLVDVRMSFTLPRYCLMRLGPAL